MSASATGTRRASAGAGSGAGADSGSRGLGGVGRAVAVDAAIGMLVTALLLAGLARPGFPLLRDWVATPTPPLSDAALGLGESAARAVPQDVAMVWAARALGAVGLPVWPLTGLLTALFCVWLAVAAGALVRLAVPAVRSTGARSAGVSVWLRLPAVVGAVWNPFVVERLLQGHWSLFAGVAAVMTMPVLLAGAGGLRIAAACAALAAAGLTPTGWVLAVIAAAVALSCSSAHGARRVRAALALAATAAVTALPWLLATLLAGAGGMGAGGTGPGGMGSSSGVATGVAAFAARAEPGIGTLGSVVALGGIWNSEAVPASRATWWAAAALVVLVLVWVVAAPALWRARHTPVVRATVPIAVATWLLIAAAATGPGIAALEALVTAVPGAGLLRDTQKFVALALPATVLALALAARVLARCLRPAGAGLLITAVTVASVPDAPAVLWSQLRPVTFGPGWAAVAEIVDGEPGDLLVLPAGSFRSTQLWADGAAVLDPAPRLLDTRVLVPGDLVVGGAAVSGEGDRARRATEALLRGDDPSVLTDLGVRWVLDERTSAGPRGESERTLAGTPGAGDDSATTTSPRTTTSPPRTTTTTRFADSELVLHELAWRNGQDGPVAASSAARGAVLSAHALWLLTLAGAGAFALAGVGVRPGRRAGVFRRSRSS